MTPSKKVTMRFQFWKNKVQEKLGKLQDLDKLISNQSNKMLFLMNTANLIASMNYKTCQALK